MELLAFLYAVFKSPWKAVGRPGPTVFGKLVDLIWPVSICHAVEDDNLVLDAGQTVIATGNTTAINTEGGALMWANVITGVMSGGGTTCDIYVQFSLDAGSNYYMAGKFQQLGPTNDNAFMRIPVYIPRPNANTGGSSNVTTAQPTTLVRVRYVVAGGAPSYVITKLFLTPMLDMSVPATDESLTEGAKSLIAAL